MDPVRSFTTLCLTCFEPDRVTSARMEGKTLYACAACGAVDVMEDGAGLGLLRSPSSRVRGT